MPKHSVSRRDFLRKVAATAFAAPLFIDSKVFGANDRFTMGCIGMGGQGRGDMGNCLGFKEVQVLAVCDVATEHRTMAKDMVDKRYETTDTAAYNDFRHIIHRDDIDSVLIGTPDHWHAIIAVEAMKHGKDVYCEKPETLTVREGQIIIQTARRYGRVFSGGSQRVWGDYNWFHQMVRGGRIGEVREASGKCRRTLGGVLPGTSSDTRRVDWDRWLGPAPKRPFHPTLIKGGFRGYRDYSGGGMTDWGCHGFGGALFTCNLHQTGPVEIIPPDSKEHERLTYTFANGVRIYHGGGWGGILSFKGTEGEVPNRENPKDKETAPNIYIPNYKGAGASSATSYTVFARDNGSFRDIAIVHRTASLCHLGNIAYWLKRPLKWDPVKEEILNDPEASRWLDRPKREPWTLA